MTKAYSNPGRAADPHALPDVEIFYVSTRDAEEARDRLDRGDYGHYEADDLTESGWYWWPCFPGCLPDGDANGPFASREAALADAQEDAS
jgi:hypothetical protein